MPLANPQMAAIERTALKKEKDPASVERRAALNLALGVGEKRHPAVSGCTLGQAGGKGALPIGARAKGFVLEIQRGIVGN